MKRLALALCLVAGPLAADPREAFTEGFPKTTEWANGDYFTVTRWAADCNLTQRVTQYKADGTVDDSSQISINIGWIDPDQIEFIAGGVTLIGDRYEFACQTIEGSGAACDSAPMRPGENISIGDGGDPEAFLAAAKEWVAECAG